MKLAVTVSLALACLSVAETGFAAVIVYKTEEFWSENSWLMKIKLFTKLSDKMQ